MAEVGVVTVPRARWGGRWAKALEVFVGSAGSSDWTELCEYAGTSAYQVARALNLGPFPKLGDNFAVNRAEPRPDPTPK